MAVTNGCNFLPPGPWDLCCDVHDIAFDAGGGITEYITANAKVIWCIAQGDPILAGLVVAPALLLFSWAFFEWKFLKGKNIVEIVTGETTDGKF